MKLKLWAKIVLVWAGLMLASLIHAGELPQRAQLQFVDNNGLSVNMDFEQKGGKFQISTDLSLLIYQMQFVSSGTLSGTMLNPLTYTDSRFGKLYAQARFNGQSVDYGRVSDTSRHLAVNGPVYDMFALAWQLGFNQGKLPVNTYLTNGKKVYPLDAVKNLGSAQIMVNGQHIEISQYSISRGDDRVEYAFAPQLNNIPVRISYMDNGKVYTLQLKAGQINGKAI